MIATQVFAEMARLLMVGLYPKQIFPQFNSIAFQVD